MKHILQELFHIPDCRILIYVHDVIVLSNDHTVLKQIEQKILDIYKKYNITLNPLKGASPEAKIKHILGLEIIEDEIKIPDSLKEKIKVKLQTVKSKKSLQRIVGLLSYYKDFYKSQIITLQKIVQIIAKLAEDRKLPDNTISTISKAITNILQLPWKPLEKQKIPLNS